MKPSAETQLRKARYDLRHAIEQATSYEYKLRQVLVGLERLKKTIGVNLGTMALDDPCR